jgi:hypothetical protein
MQMFRGSIILFLLATVPFISFSQHHNDTLRKIQHKPEADVQPFLSHAMRLKESLSFLGSSLSQEDERRLAAITDKKFTQALVEEVQSILDPYCIAYVNINPESRIKVERGPAVPSLIQHGWVSFLVKVKNEAGITAQLNVAGKNAESPMHVSSFASRTPEEKKLSAGQVANRFLDMQMYRRKPLNTHLSGMPVEYAVVQIYSKDAGQREAELAFNVGQGTQDLGFRNSINILFKVRAAKKIIFDIRDTDGSPSMASFTITDGIERALDDTLRTIANTDFRITAAQREFVVGDASLKTYTVPKRLRGIYPLPSRRVAAYDQYPDFFFQPQIYRSSGEHVLLPAGEYDIMYTRGPEYVAEKMRLRIPDSISEMTVSFRLKRWINMASLGWYSGDHHVHAAGCSHYESPEEGVRPADMWRQVLGEDLNVAAVLTWGPGWYHQKQFFTGKDDTNSTRNNLMRYDVEVSGFPSSHAGHLVLLGMKEDDYPGTTEIEQWPGWTVPVLTWAKSQGAATGYAHSGWGLEPIQRTNDLPNYVLPKMDNIGANEYIVTVTRNLIDFFSAGDTPAPWELNMWYHTLNCGFTPRLSGETDFPCIFDERVGLARSYFRSDGKITYQKYIQAIKDGRSYVSDGRSHIMNLRVNETESGTRGSRVNLRSPQTINIEAKVAVLLPDSLSEEESLIRSRKLDEQPYWSTYRTRIGATRSVAVELIVNGRVADTVQITADGKPTDVKFKYAVEQSSWIALRIFPSAHTNPVSVIMNGKPIAVKASADWCAQSVEQCWKMKQANMKPEERTEARKAYDEAKRIYQEVAAKATQ